jgi:hypothetical protein
MILKKGMPMRMTAGLLLSLVAVQAQPAEAPGQHHVFTRPSFVKDLEERMSDCLHRYVQAAP